MTKTVTLNLAKISYQGDSIGREIRITVKLFNHTFSLDKRIKSGDIKQIDYILGKFEVSDNLMESDVFVEVIEKDMIFSDKGRGEISIQLDPNTVETQIFSTKISVGETRSWWKKLLLGNKKAIFDIQFSFKVQSMLPNIQKYTYAGVNDDEDYNRYDDLILELVNHWSIYKNGVKKEKNTVLHLWSIVSIVILFTFSAFWQTNSNELKATVLNSIELDKTEKIENIEIKKYSSNTDLFATVIESEEDWWEDLRIGEWKNGKVDWLTMHDAPTEQSILSFRFINPKGFKDPLLEVYRTTHMGNGSLYLYKIHNKKVDLLFQTRAVDGYEDSIWAKENYDKYGYYTCGETYANSRLKTQYENIKDGKIIGVMLSGQINVDCEQESNTYSNLDRKIIRVSEKPTSQYFSLVYN